MTSNGNFHKNAWTNAEKALAGTELTTGGKKKSAASCQTRYGNVSVVAVPIMPFSLLYSLRRNSMLSRSFVVSRALAGMMRHQSLQHRILSGRISLLYEYFYSFLCFFVLKSHQSRPKFAKWQKRAFPLYDDIYLLAAGASATGQNTFQPGIDTQHQASQSATQGSPSSAPAASQDDDESQDEEEQTGNQTVSSQVSSVVYKHFILI